MASSLRRRKKTWPLIPEVLSAMGKTMNYGLRKLSTRTKLMAALVALAMAGVSHAQTLVGGGATLPAIGYVGSNASNPSTPQVGVTGVPVSSTSLFGASGVATSYCLTGSGAGKNILAGIASNSVQDTCPTDSTGTLHGFGANASGVGRSTLTQPSFAGADAPLAATDFANYISTTLGNHSGTNPVEFPAVAGAVAIAFNLKDNTGATVTSSEVNLSDTQICSIFSGAVTTWNDSSLASAFTLPAGRSIPANPINVAYRSDGSGTTFSLSNHLAAACNTTVNPLETSQTFFATSGTYVVDNFFGGTHPALPTNWIPASGNPALANAIATNANAIGYVETANALATNPGLQFADVDGKSPTANFNSTLTLAALSVQTNSAISTTNNANGTPQVVALSNPTTPLPTVTNACIMLVKPSAYAVPGSIAGDINPVGNYPIVAVSYLLGNSVGNGTDLANTRTLVTSPYNTSIRSTVTTIGGSTGLQYLDNTTNNVFTTARVSGCYAM